MSSNESNNTIILKKWRKSCAMSHIDIEHFLNSNRLACWWAEDWAINSHALRVSPIKFCSGLHRGKRTRFYWRGDRAAWDWKVKIPSSNNIRGSLSSEKVFKIIVKDMSVSPIKYCLGLPREGSESETWSRQKMSNAMQNASFSVLWECSLCLD